MDINFSPQIINGYFVTREGNDLVLEHPQEMAILENGFANLVEEFSIEGKSQETVEEYVNANCSAFLLKNWNRIKIVDVK